MATTHPVDETVRLISRVCFNTFLRGAESWAKLDITMPQLKVLMLLGLHGSAPVSALASRMNVSPPNVTGILDRLEQHALVRRTNDTHDRRVVRVVLTDEGRQILVELQHAGEDRLYSSISQMRTSDQRALYQGIAALVDAGRTDTSCLGSDGSTDLTLPEATVREPVSVG